MFGWDTETTAVFPATLRFLEEQKVPVAYFNLLTPDKGTEYYERMREEGRIFNQNEIGRWPGQPCHIIPRNYTPWELEYGVQRLQRQFYRFSSVARRLPLPFTPSAIASWVLNLSQRRVAYCREGDFSEY
jgi:hypothetical protein